MRELRLAWLLVTAFADDALPIHACLRWGDARDRRRAARLLARLRAAIHRTLGREREGGFPYRRAARIGPPPATALPAVRATGRVGPGAGLPGAEPGVA